MSIRTSSSSPWLWPGTPYSVATSESDAPQKTRSPSQAKPPEAAVVFVAVLVLDPLSSLVLLFAGPMLILLLAVIGRRTRDLTERRVEELESLVRELTGLTYLALDGEQPAAGGPTDRSAEAAREAA